MVGQICGRCGLALSSGGCGCRPDDAETAVLPVIGGPELVRPYVHPADAVGPAAADDLIEAADAVDAAEPLLPAARYLPATARLPERRNAALPVLRTSPPLPAVRHRALPPARVRRRRRGLLIAVGALAVAGLGTVAAALPHMLHGDSTDQSLPAPGVTVAMASSDPDSGTPDAASATAGTASSSAAPSAAATRRAAAAQTSAARTTPSASPTPAPTAPSQSSSPSPSSTPSSTASASTASSASAALASASTTLKTGDSGSAVATLQSQLRALRIDPGLRVDGRYGSRTERDVATFQSWFGVTGDPTGVYGPNSQAKMAQQTQQTQHQNR